MQISLEAYTGRFPDRLSPAPLEYAGQWVAWNKQRTQIISHGPRFREVRAEAIAAGYDEPLMQKVLATPFVGQS